MMSSITVEGIYENGKVTLLETPDGVEKAKVRVTFVDAEEEDEGAGLSKHERIQCLMESMRAGVDFGNEKFDRESIYQDRMEDLERRRG